MRLVWLTMLINSLVGALNWLSIVGLKAWVSRLERERKAGA